MSIERIRRKREVARDTLDKLNSSIMTLGDIKPMRLQTSDLLEKLEDLKKVKESFAMQHHLLVSEIDESSDDYAREVSIETKFEEHHQRLHYKYWNSYSCVMLMQQHLFSKGS